MLLGELLIGKGLVTPAQVAAALERQRQEGGRIGNHLVAIHALTVDELLTALRAQQEVEVTLRLCASTLERYERIYGILHSNTHRAQFNLARALVAAGCAGDAVPLAEAALKGHQRMLGPEHAWTQEADRFLADVRGAAARAEKNGKPVPNTGPAIGV